MTAELPFPMASSTLNLECAQISRFEQLLDQLLQNPQVKRLLLYGNRLKSLPDNLSFLKQLEFLDISGNLFSGPIENLLPCLRSLGSLRELRVTLNNEQEALLIADALPLLQVINGNRLHRDRPVAPPKSTPMPLPPERSTPVYSEMSSTPPIEAQTNFLPSFGPLKSKNNIKDPEKSVPTFKFAKELSVNDLSVNFDVFERLLALKHFFKADPPTVLKQELKDFVQTTLKQLNERLKETNLPVKRELDILRAKYSLSDIVLEKYLVMMASGEPTDFAKLNSKLIAGLQSSLKQLFERFEQLVEELRGFTTSKVEKMKEKLKVVVADTSPILDKLEKSLRFGLEAVEGWEEDLANINQSRLEQREELKSLKAENQLLIRKLLYETNQRVSESHLRHSLQEQPRTQPVSDTNISSEKGLENQAFKSSAKGKSPAQQLAALKETMDEIYTSKQAVERMGGHRDTLESHLFVFLKKKYGLKSLITDHAQQIIAGIQRFKTESPEVLLFGKILRNEVNEEFWRVIKDLRALMRESARTLLQKQTPNALKPQIDKELEEYTSKRKVFDDEIEWILSTCFGSKCEEFRIVAETISLKEGCSFQEVEDCVCYWRVSKHVATLKEFAQLFKSLDGQAGVMDRHKLRQFLELLNIKTALLDIGLDVKLIVEKLDSQGGGRITFSQIVVFLLEMPIEFEQKRTSYFRVLNLAIKSTDFVFSDKMVGERT